MNNGTTERAIYIIAIRTINLRDFRILDSGFLYTFAIGKNNIK